MTITKSNKLIDDIETKIGEAHDSLKELLDTEQERYDGLSEKAQEGEKGQRLQTIIDAFQSALDSLDNAISDLASARD